MLKTEIKGNEIEGNLDIFIANNCEVLIHGDPEGLRSFAQLLLKLADLNQEEINNQDLPIGAREHYHFRPSYEISNSSVETVVGRLDAKGTGEFYSRFIPKKG